MATPQWVLLQRRIEPTQKSLETQYERNARRRQKEAVRSAMRRGFLKHLDQQMILESVADPEVADLNQVRYISLPASTIQSIDNNLTTANLCVVNLPYNYLADLNPFCSCVNLIKLDVSGNQIRNVPEGNFWASLLSLKILYLNNNMISGKETLLSLSCCARLQVLTMYDNPVSLLPNYRHIAVNCILSLKALDYHVISDEEIVENLHLAGKFRSRAKPFHRLLYLPVNKGETLTDELSRIYDMILCIDMVLAHHSPVVIIQRWIRGWLTRNRLLKYSAPQLRELVKHRKKGSEHVNRVLRRSATNAFTEKREQGRLGTSDLPIPPPSTPAPITDPLLHLHPPPMEKKKDPHRPTTTEVTKTIKATKEILNDNGKKKRRNAKASKMPKLHVVLASSTEEDVKLSVHGEHQSVGEINKVDHVKDTKMKDANEIREAESTIKKAIVEMKKKVVPVEKRAEPWAKDSHAFIRTQTTMSLSMLKDITRRQSSLRRENEISKKAEAIARVKEEREARKKRIYENQQILRDAIAIWRDREERRLQERKQQMELEHEELRLKRADNMETMVEVIKNKREGEKLVTTFTQQHNLLDKTSLKEHTESLKKSHRESLREKVQNSRISAQEQAEIVNKFMELRQEKLRNDNSEQKEKLNSQMIQFASQKLMEAKQKVAKVKAWKKIAKSLKASTEEDGHSNMPTNTLSNAFESIPEADAVDVGLLGPLLKAYTSASLSNGYSPQSMRKTTHESHRTWQRGCLVMQEEEEEEGDKDHHFPTLEPVSDLQPLMYDQLQPHPYFHVGTTPCNSYHDSPTTSSTHLRANSPVVHPPNDFLTGQLIQDRLKLMVD